VFEKLKFNFVFCLVALTLVSKSFTASADIFGADDRVHPEKGTKEYALAASVAVGVLTSLIEDNELGKVDLLNDTLSDFMCPDERFAEEPSLAYACTGFLIGPDLLLTAGHCASNYKEVFNEPGDWCESYSWMFDYIQNSSQKAKLKNLSPDKIYKCREIIYAVADEDDPKRDFAMIRLERSVLDRPVLKLSQKEVKPGDSVTMIGSPLGMPLKYTRNALAISNQSKSNKILTNLDAFQGNSGSPVFNSDHEVVGILVSGSPNETTYEDKKLKCHRYNRCDDNGENCVLSEEDVPRGFGFNGSDVEKLFRYSDILEKHIPIRSEPPKTMQLMF